MKNKVTCYVCTQTLDLLDAVYIGNSLYRHSGCESGSEKWMDSTVGLRSEMRQYYLLCQKKSEDKSIEKVIYDQIFLF